MKGIKKVKAIVPEDYIYFECPYCGAVNDSLGDDIVGFHKCVKCGRSVEVTEIEL